jgi:threonine-phosphate decarboxylase
LFLCNPNNPTGKTIGSSLLREILDFCETHDILLVLDECFNGFLERPEQHTLRHRIQEYNKLVILDAVTKRYGMAGRRLGYCLSGNSGLIEGVRRGDQPWPVSSLAQAAGLSALEDTKYLERVRSLVRQEKPRLTAVFEKIGIRILGSEANYLFFFTDEPQFDARLKEKGILIRNCANYDGLSEGYYRVSVRTPRENRRLAEALSEITAR